MDYKGYIGGVGFDDLAKVYCRLMINSGAYSIVTFETGDEG